jgi:hypothetical protein
MTIMTNGPSISEFDFETAARVFIGCKERLFVHVPQLETPSARLAARAAVSLDWSLAAAKKASEQQMQLVREHAGGDDERSRMAGANCC